MFLDDFSKTTQFFSKIFLLPTEEFLRRFLRKKSEKSETFSNYKMSKNFFYVIFRFFWGLYKLKFE